MTLSEDAHKSMILRTNEAADQYTHAIWQFSVMFTGYESFTHDIKEVSTHISTLHYLNYG